MTEHEERLVKERDAAKEVAVRLSDELRRIRNQDAEIAVLAVRLDETRGLLKEVLDLLVRPLVGKKLKGRNRARPLVDIAGLVERNQPLLDRAVAAITEQ